MINMITHWLLPTVMMSHTVLYMNLRHHHEETLIFNDNIHEDFLIPPESASCFVKQPISTEKDKRKVHPLSTTDATIHFAMCMLSVDLGILSPFFTRSSICFDICSIVIFSTTTVSSTPKSAVIQLYVRSQHPSHLSLIETERNIHT